jgi:O-antigen/teichoic acid export membrane protein
MLERFAATSNTREVGKLMLGPATLMVVLISVLVCLVTIFIPPVVMTFLPDYSRAIPLIEILVPGVFFLSLSSVSSMYVISVNLQTHLFKIQIFSIVVCIIANVAFWYSGLGVSGIAYATLICYSVYGIGYFLVSASIALEDMRRVINLLFKFLIVFFVMLLSLHMTKNFYSSGNGFSSLIYISFERFVCVVFFLIPTLYLVSKDEGLILLLKTEYSRWRSKKAI